MRSPGESINVVTYPPGSEPPVVVLDRVEPGRTPPYCIHGRASCVGGCGEWVWLGDQTHEVVVSGMAAPLCMQCAKQLIPPDVERLAQLEDHRRADGPH
jgi:hypothetical protein